MKATAKFIRTSPRKLRLVADAIRSLPVDQALLTLRFMDKRAAAPLLKAVQAAVGSAKNTSGLTPDKLAFDTLIIGDGPIYKRWQAVSRGMAHSIKKRTSHINVVLKEKK